MTKLARVGKRATYISSHAHGINLLDEKHNFQKNSEALVVATIRSKVEVPKEVKNALIFHKQQRRPKSQHTVM
jgi:hypothetical protein